MQNDNSLDPWDHDYESPGLMVRFSPPYTYAVATGDETEPVVGIGVAVCGRKDDFVKAIGATLAIGRALKDQGEQMVSRALEISNLASEVKKTAEVRDRDTDHDAGVDEFQRAQIRQRMDELGINPDERFARGTTALEDCLDALRGKGGLATFKTVCAILGKDWVTNEFVIGCGCTAAQHRDAEAKERGIDGLLKEIFGEGLMSRVTVFDLNDPDTELPDDVPDEVRSFVDGLRGTLIDSATEGDSEDPVTDEDIVRVLREIGGLDPFEVQDCGHTDVDHFRDAINGRFGKAETALAKTAIRGSMAQFTEKVQADADVVKPSVAEEQDLVDEDLSFPDDTVSDEPLERRSSGLRGLLGF